MLSTKSLYLKLIAVLLTCCSFVVFGQTTNDMRRPQTASEMKRDQMIKKQTLGQVESNSYQALQREVPLFQLIRQKSSGVVNAEFKEVQRANMSKLGEDGKPIYNEKGKVMKGPNYSEPNLKQFIE